MNLREWKPKPTNQHGDVKTQPSTKPRQITKLRYFIKKKIYFIHASKTILHRRAPNKKTKKKSWKQSEKAYCPTPNISAPFGSLAHQILLDETSNIYTPLHFEKMKELRPKSLCHKAHNHLKAKTIRKQRQKRYKKIVK